MPTTRYSNPCFMLAILGAAFLTSVVAERKGNMIPDEAAQALRAPDKTILYSLEPWGPVAKGDVTFHDFKVLGQTELDRTQAVTAIGEFQSAILGWDGGMAYCFDPRHAIRVTFGSHTYDFLLCYRCHQLYVYRDNKIMAELGASGSPKVLNGLLAAAKVPLSTSDGDPDRKGHQTRSGISQSR